MRRIGTQLVDYISRLRLQLGKVRIQILTDLTIVISFNEAMKGDEVLGAMSDVILQFLLWITRKEKDGHGTRSRTRWASSALAKATARIDQERRGRDDQALVIADRDGSMIPPDVR